MYEIPADLQRLIDEGFYTEAEIINALENSLDADNYDGPMP